MHFSVFSLAGLIALIVADSVPKGDTYLGVSRRTKRGGVKDTAKILGKAGKYVARIWRVSKAKRVLLRDAKLIKAPSGALIGKFFYSKLGGKERAELDFILSTPNNVHTFENSNNGRY